MADIRSQVKTLDEVRRALAEIAALIETIQAQLASLDARVTALE